MPYGTLRVKTTVGVREYPINDHTRVAILHQLRLLSHFRPRYNYIRWLNCLSLNNKLALINPNFVQAVELIGEDVKPMPEYYCPEIYRALDNLDASEIPQQLRISCEMIISDIGEEEAMRMVSYTRVTYDNGEDEWNILDGGSVNTFFGLEAAAFDIPQPTFAEIEEEGYYRARYANLEHVAVMEVASDRYYKLTGNWPSALRRRTMPLSSYFQANAARMKAGAAGQD